MKKYPIVEITLIILGTILYFLANLQRVAVPGAIFTLLQNDLQTTAQSIASLGASFMYVYALSQLVIGVLIARYGGFRVITVGAVLFFIGSLIFPFSNSMPVLYFSRVLIGCGSASFYLGMINETRKVVAKKNFGVALSFVLLIGYLGGIVANAPLAVCVEKMGWRETFVVTAIATTIISLLFLVIDRFAEHQQTDKSIHMDLSLFKQVLANKRNINLYSFACLNYGLYYVIQTCIGKKFLEDFCSMPVMQAATVLSVMGALYAFAGSIIAFMSKSFLNRRTIFLRFASANTLFVFTTILICICFNITNAIIPSVLFCTIAFWASLSPLLVPLLHDINGAKTAGTSVSIMTCGFYIAVGILGNIVGFFLDMFTKNSNTAYMSIFGLSVILSLFAFINVFKIEESEKTKRLLAHVDYLTNKAKEEQKTDEENHWHDKYEHDLYNNI